MDVEAFMKEFFVELQAIWKAGDALDAAAFALWRVNWVHPFRDGNGRTARSFAYCCLCAKLEVTVPPGAPTVVDQITTTRPDCTAAIRVGNAAAADNKGPQSILQVQMGMCSLDKRS
jgi:Fic/DOC family protein